MIDIVIVIPAPDPDPDPQRDPAQQTKKKVVPDCGDVAGGVLAPVGLSLADLGQDDAEHAGWVHVTCQSQGDEWWMWLDPGVNAEAIARTGSPTTSALYGWIIAVELVILACLALTTLWALKRWGPQRLRGMATAAEAEAALGLRRLRKHRHIIRPDLYPSRSGRSQ